MTNAAELAFLSEPGVLVTDARFVVYNQTYAIASVTSVKMLSHSANVAPGVILLVLGALCVGHAAMSASIAPALLELPLVAFGFVVATKAKPSHHV